MYRNIVSFSSIYPLNTFYTSLVHSALEYIFIVRYPPTPQTSCIDRKNKVQNIFFKISTFCCDVNSPGFKSPTERRVEFDVT